MRVASQKWQSNNIQSESPTHSASTGPKPLVRKKNKLPTGLSHFGGWGMGDGGGESLATEAWFVSY